MTMSRQDTYVYVISNGDGVSKVGMGGADRVATWKGRGWRVNELTAYANRNDAARAESRKLRSVRRQGHGQAMPKGFDGYTETFSSVGLSTALDSRDQGQDQDPWTWADFDGAFRAFFIAVIAVSLLPLALLLMVLSLMITPVGLIASAFIDLSPSGSRAEPVEPQEISQQVPAKSFAKQIHTSATDFEMKQMCTHWSNDSTSFRPSMVELER
ncbi:hypothetical protein N9D66_01955 [Candidatus Nanopelagicales bacterium]|nr:hypothetical protein [Candidatus Nanopelagicales bacterium]